MDRFLDGGDSSQSSPQSGTSSVTVNDTSFSHNKDNVLQAFRRQLQSEVDDKTNKGWQSPTTALSLAWKDLSVRGKGGKNDLLYANNVGSVFTTPYRALFQRRRSPKPEPSKKHEISAESPLPTGERYLLHDLGGVVKPGEMLLVLGQPGAGTTTFLKTLAGLVEGYAGIDGSVYYGNVSSKKSKAFKDLEGQIAYNADDESHFPNLQVGRTLDFALANTTPARTARPDNDEKGVLAARESDNKAKEDLLRIFGLIHTMDTKVGDALVRGVSGGERKRVSLAEILARRASILLWDKPTRGLDASTALDYTKIMRILADVENKAVAVTLYQAGNAIFNQFDKVLVLAEGECIFYGPRARAQGYFEELGLDMLDGANIGDFLTGSTALHERIVRSDAKHRVPMSVQDFVRAYRKSEVYRDMQAELQQHLSDETARAAEVSATREVLQREKHRRALQKQPFVVSYMRQLKAALRREIQQRWGDQFSFWARQGNTVAMSFVTGSLFYMIPQNTGGLFLSEGFMFLTFIYPSILAMAEATLAFEGRSILAKHKSLSLYRPGVLAITQVIADLPMYFVPLLLYTIVLYFLAGLKSQAGSYFIYFLFTYLTTCIMASFFRMVGYAFRTFEDASKVTGFAFNLFASYSGYFIPIPYMKNYLGWTRWINPMFYAFEAMAVNELSGKTYQCVPTQLVPYGPGYENTANQGCAIAGAGFGASFVEGDAFLDVALNFSTTHVWRNFGIMMALWAFTIVMTIVFLERTPVAGSTKGYLLYKRGSGGKAAEDAARRQSAPRDEEEGNQPTQIFGHEKKSPAGDQSAIKAKIANSIFTWKNLSYTVNSGGQDLKLLDKVQGWCAPGQLTALMGSSGAGKTTLLDVLAQRKDTGEITGEVLLNGQQLPIAFQRTTGYVEQLDIHLPQTTVREALEFSALLRQPRSIPDKEKLEYVDTIIDLLELHDLENAIVGIPGAGLGVEQRKRLTIGVELVAKPRLLFADEPTSGLAGQSAFTILKFLRKLANVGQSVLVTVHQPSASLFAEFDNLLLLKKGGKTAYFGSVAKMPEYFGSHGAPFPADSNPAEYMIDVVSGDLFGQIDWNEVWLKSQEHQSVVEEIESLKAKNRGQKSDTEEDEYQFAATNATQFKVVSKRASLQMWRNVDYIVNKFALHIATGLLNGFSYFKLGASYQDLQNRVFTIFGFIFVAPGVIAQMQPKFIANRDIFEAREKKAKMYTWRAFIVAEIIAEIPYLFICGTLYFACWWGPAGFSFAPTVAGPVILQIYFYEMLYTGIGQFIAAYAPSATFAALVNPTIISILVLTNGAFIPYSQMQEFWKYWLYWLNPFQYLIGGLLVFPLWNQEVKCTASELGRFVPPNGQTCGEYMADFLTRTPGYLTNPAATDVCEYCSYSRGSEFLANLDLGKYIYGWRDICITLLFVISSYGLVFIMMKLRTKQTKTAKA